MVFVAWRDGVFCAIPGDAIGPFVSTGGARQEVKRVITRLHRFHKIVRCDRELGDVVVEEFREHLVGHFGLVDPVSIQGDLMGRPLVRV